MNIGFIGTGSMGNPVASNFLAAGHKLFVHDINKQATENLLNQGAVWCEYPAKVAEKSSVIFLSLPSHIEVSAVCFEQFKCFRCFSFYFFVFFHGFFF
jgi:3-hydroxyisobutyrate dehydrogenase-like beta-hydroxyacid dehydrogenase